jgi:hypothetical protein
MRSLRIGRQQLASLDASHCTIRLMSCLLCANPSYNYSQNLNIQLLREYGLFPVMLGPMVEDIIPRRNREECTRLLTLLVSATQRLIKPYALPMLRVLLLKANDPNATVAANVLMCLGELACVGGEDVNPHVPELMEIILTKLADPSIARRDAALHALGQVCSSAGYVIQPLVEYPQLLQIFGRILKSESNSSVRREVIKVLGIIGALDPYRRKVRYVCPSRETASRDLTLYRRVSQTKNRTRLKRPQQRQLISHIRRPRLRMTTIRRWLSMRCSAF